MAKTKQQKEEIIKTLVGRIQNAKLAVLTDLEGLTVNDSQELRDKCKENQIELISAKKTLIQKYAKYVKNLLLGEKNGKKYGMK